MLHMRMPLLLALIVSLASPASANDGVFYATGDTLFPVKETNIEMAKEVLIMTRDGDHMKVEVNFEFRNTGPQVTQLVGFVTPPAGGDTPETHHPHVSDFTVEVNGVNLKHEVSRAKDSGFKLSEKKADGHDFIYHFPVTFAEGVTKIRHTYRYRGGGSVYHTHYFPYRLTTGAQWKDGRIGDFTLELDMGEDIAFALPWSFRNDGRPAEWKLEGSGILVGVKQDIDDFEMRMVYMKNGKVILKAQNFTPEKDFSADVYNAWIMVEAWTASEEDNEFLELRSILPETYTAERMAEELPKLTDRQLLLMRNLPYAWAGHEFTSKELREYFGKMLWYRPVADKEVALSKREAAYVELIKNEESRRRKAMPE